MGYYSGDNSDMVSKGLHAPKPGLNSVGEYQVAGRPFLKTLVNADITVNILASTAKAADDNTITFPFVTSRIVIQNAGGCDIVAYFCSTNIQDADAGEVDRSAVKHNKNYFVIPAKAAAASPSTLDLKIKTRKLYIAGYGGSDLGANGSVSIAAELTNIEEPYDCDVDNIDGISG